MHILCKVSFVLPGQYSNGRERHMWVTWFDLVGLGMAVVVAVVVLAVVVVVSLLTSSTSGSCRRLSVGPGVR